MPEKARMRAKNKTREQLTEEFKALSQKIKKLEAAEAKRRQAEEALRESEKRYKSLYSMVRLICDNVPYLIWAKDLGKRFIFTNKAICEKLLNAKDTEEPIGKTDLFFANREIAGYPENPDYHTFGEICTDSDSLVMKNRKPKRFDEFGNVKGKFLFLDVYEAPFWDEQGNMIGTVGYGRDITKEKQAGEEGQRAEKLKNAVYKISEATNSATNLKELFRSVHNIIVELMPAKNFYIALYNPQKEILSFPYFIDEYDEAPVPKKLGRGLTEYVLRTGEPLLASPEKFEELEKKGEVESIGAPSIDWLGVPLKVEGQTIGVLVVQTYIEGVRYGEDDKNMLMFVSTQAAMAIRRKQAEEQIKASLREKEVLLREIHHRVKNNMQVMSSLINLQARHISNPEAIDILKESQSRIRSMALVHEKLYQSKDLAKINIYDYLSSLAIHLFNSYKIDPNLIHLNLNVDNVFLDIHSATPCGLIVNELISNSLKHAFPEGRKGEINIELHPLEDRKLELIVKDNGVGFPEGLDFRQTESLGMQLVDMLVHQLEGTIELLKDGGTEFRIVFEELKSKPRP
jgi:two-component sensor histidine kinase/PAS domain-containing protein